MTQHVFPDLLVVRVDPPGEQTASVTLASEQAEVTVFCHLCSLVAGQRIRNCLTVLDAWLQAPYLPDWPEDERTRLGQERLTRIGHYQYTGVGRVVDAERGLVLVRGFLIDFEDALPAEHAEFDIERLDCEGEAVDRDESMNVAAR